MTPHVLPDRHPVEPSRVFDEDLHLSSVPLGIGNAGHVYEGKSQSGKTYAVKLYRPYTEAELTWDRNLFKRKGITISDDLLKTSFDRWYRESRVYDHIDRYVESPLRSLFLEYYGTTTIPYSVCPRRWRQAFPDFNSGRVSAIILELHKERRPGPVSSLISDEATLDVAKDIYSEIKDLEYVHIYIHIREIIDILHQHKIVHRDFGVECIMDGPVVFDFSRSWIDFANLPCIDELFKPRPRPFERRKNGELAAIRFLISSDYAGEQLLKGLFKNFADCDRCKTQKEQIILMCN